MKQEIAFIGFMGVSGIIEWDKTNNKFKATMNPEFWNPEKQNHLKTISGRTCHECTIEDMVSHFRNVLIHGTLDDANSSQ